MNIVQKAVRKDVERMSGCIQGRFQILKSRRHEWSDTEIIDIAHVCVILHNMLVEVRIEGALEDERDENGNLLHGNSVVAEFEGLEAHSDSDFGLTSGSNTENDDTQTSWIDTLLGIDNSIRNVHEYNKLWGALADHIWNATGEENSSINQCRPA